MTNNLQNRLCGTAALAGIAAIGLGATAAQASLVDGLEAYWDFEDAGNLFHDASGNGNVAGEVVGSPTQGTGYVGSGSLLLDGASGAHINTQLLSDVDSFTISAWVRLDEADLGASQTIAAKYFNFEDSGFQFYYHSNNRPYGMVMGGGQSNTGIGTAAINATEWNHLALTYADGTGRMYINGELSAENTSMPFVANPDGGVSFAIGMRPFYEGRHLSGELDELGVWNRALTQDEVQALAGGAVIPEPASMALLAGAGAMLMLRRR